MTDEKAGQMHEELIHRLWPGSSGLDKPWRYVIGRAESEDAKAVCLAIELLAQMVYTPDKPTRFLEGLGQ